MPKAHLSRRPHGRPQVRHACGDADARRLQGVRRRVRSAAVSSRRDGSEQSVFGRIAASGWYTASLSMRLIVEGELTIAGGLVGLGGEMTWPRPAYPGRYAARRERGARDVACLGVETRSRHRDRAQPNAESARRARASRGRQDARAAAPRGLVAARGADDAPFAGRFVELVAIAQRKARRAHRRQAIVELDPRREPRLRRADRAGGHAAVDHQRAAAPRIDSHG